MNTREKLLSLAIVMLIAMRMYDNLQIGELQEQVHEQRVKLFKHCVEDYGVNNCRF